jgi:hypothetical protein
MADLKITENGFMTGSAHTAPSHPTSFAGTRFLALQLLDTPYVALVAPV